MSVTVAITNQKGGVGKTTTAINLAYYLAKTGKSVLLVDADPQGNATSGLGIDKKTLQLTLAEVLLGQVKPSDAVLATNLERLAVLPSLASLAEVEVQLAASERPVGKLKTALNDLDYDIILIDCPPSLSLLTVNALIAADFVMLPVQAEFYALEGLGQLMETTKLIRERTNARLEVLGVLLTMYDSRTTLSQQVLAEVKKHFPGKVFETVIPRNVRLAEAPSHGVPVGLYDRWSKGARAYKTLAKEVQRRLAEEKKG